MQDYAVKHGVKGTDLSLLTHKLEFWLNSSATLLLSKSQISMHCWVVAATSQYLLGLKHKALIMSPASKEYKRFPSAKSHSIATPSLPPLAQREPSGDTVTV